MQKIVILIVVIVGLGVIGWYLPKSSVNLSEIEFDESGRAKAIESETDLWQFYDDKKAGFSLKYPHNVVMVDKVGNLSLTIESVKIDDLDFPSFNKEEVLEDIQSLKNGQYGEEYDWPLGVSKKVRDLGEVNGQEFMVLSRFEVCDVVFERKLLFYNNDYRILITLKEIKSNIVDNLSKYFEINEENCGVEAIWNFEKQDQFYLDLVGGKSFFTAQEWFDTFDKIVDTIEIDEVEVTETYLQLIQGAWTSLDDKNSVIEFKDGMKIDSYSGEEMNKDEFGFYDSFSITEESVKKDSGKYLIVGTGEETFEYEVVDISDEILELIYLPRGNTLRYHR